MSRHKSIFNKLTKKELVHLVESLGGIDKFKEMRKSQIQWDLSSPLEPCWDCRFIAKKLGLK